MLLWNYQEQCESWLMLNGLVCVEEEEEVLCDDCLHS